MSPAEQWSLLWALARYDLQLSDEEFGELSPRQFHWLLKRKERETEHRELLNGIVAAAVVNFSFSAPDKQAEPKDFMPSQYASAPEVSAEEIEQARARTIGCFLKGQMLAQQEREKKAHG